MIQQAELALSDADICLFMVDGRSGVTPADEFMASWLRQRIKYNMEKDLQIILVANKCELSVNCYGVIADCAKLHFGEPICVSAEETDGFSDLFQALDEGFQSIGRDTEDNVVDDVDEPAVKLCICGRPNVGKSTLINRLVSDYRCVTANEPGTTRDAIEVPLFHKSSGKHFTLVDTAGLITCPRHKTDKINQKLEL
eukprot:UN29248